MNIDESEVISRKTVGKLGEDGVVELVTKGGLNLVFAKIKGKIEALGAGSHKAIARFLARKKEPGIIWSDLNKAEHVPEDAFRHLVPYYTEVTRQYNEALKSRQR